MLKHVHTHLPSERIGLLEPSLLSGAWRGRRPSVHAKERSQQVPGLIPRQREKYHATALAVGIMLMGPFIRITEVASGISYRGSWLLSVRKQLQECTPPAFSPQDSVVAPQADRRPLYTVVLTN